ncbi:hypothetical protein F6R98_15045 [Candidatus Methylospira mobilis]|uniref:Uncharacterized protein n=1 Tax=Candidatus Methylospira mobilis TaxID=1808979 RepID=A0A5Q0BNU9_9GAMM|nr:hypothetical protein [Candidatus Methylospira mobilis]QFY43778.1 hypothetical protein F6R98_15045 [Candidatus Methylospira mobilis]WNV04768.1 hypothetical protein RP726_20635 [Candidatus Methylospira mobilis]
MITFRAAPHLAANRHPLFARLFIPSFQEFPSKIDEIQTINAAATGFVIDSPAGLKLAVMAAEAALAETGAGADERRG